MAEETQKQQNPRKLTREDIAKLPSRAAMALAARCVMRVLPATGIQGDFKFWREKAAVYIQALETSAFLAALSSSTEEERLVRKFYTCATVATTASDVAADTAYAFAADAADAAVADAAYTAADVAYAASSGAAAIDASAEADAAADAHAYAYAAASVDTSADFLWLTEYFSKYEDRANGGLVPLSFFERPLWEGVRMPEGWQEIIANWRRALEEIEQSEIYERHMLMLEGKSIVWRGMERLVFAWSEKYQVEKLANEQKSRQVAEQFEPLEGAEEVSNKQGKPRQKTSSKAVVSGDDDDEQTQAASTSGTSKASKSEPIVFLDGTIASALGDRPSTVDRLGRERLATTLSLMFDSPNQATPFTVAILGDWGAGKSTLKELIKKRLHLLAEKPDTPVHHEFVCAEFNAWEYEHTDNLHAGLAQEVVNGLTAGLPAGAKRKLIWEFAKAEHADSLRSSLIMLSLGIMALSIPTAVAFWTQTTAWQVLTGVGWFAGLVTFFTTLGPQLKALIEHPVSSELRTYLRLPSYHKHLGELAVIKQHLKTLCTLRLRGQPEAKPKRLIVFVDDLDRCRHACITKTLDAIRLVMDVEQVITVLLIDHRIAMQAVAEQYKQLEDKERDRYAIARDYLGKIIQLPVHLPVPHPDSLDGYITEVLFPKAKGREWSSEFKDALHKAEDVVSSPWKDFITTAPDVAPRVGAKAEFQSIEVSNTAESKTTTISEASKSDDKAASKQIELEKEMEDTGEDLAYFQKLTKLYSLSNPRQLLRLRNSYRLLKGLRHQQKEDKLTSKECRQLMVMLFWLEFQNQFPKGKRNAYKSAFDKAFSVPADQLKTDEEQFARLVKLEFLGEGTGPDRLKQFETLVLGVILPYYEGSVEPSVKAEQNP